jgi:hypothetical protein
MKRFTMIAAALVCWGCTESKPSSSAPAASAGPVIVRIVGRQTTITARAGARGPVYSMQTNDGKEIIPGMTLPEMHARHPDLAKHVESLHAESEAYGAWAGL